MASGTLHGGVVDTLAREIVEGSLEPGRALSLNALQERFSISRTVAREVMRVLETAGLLRSRRRVGLVVEPRSSWNVLDRRVIAWRMASEKQAEQLRSLTELRAAVEPMAAAAAARNATSTQRARIVELAGAMLVVAEERDPSRFLLLDVEFHSAVLVASDNEMFMALSGALAATLVGRVAQNLWPAHPRLEALDAHLELARAIFERRPSDAFDVTVTMLAELRRDLFGD